MPAFPAPKERQKIARGVSPWIRVSLAEEPCKGGTRWVGSPLQSSNLQPARDPGAHAPGYVLPLLRSWPLRLRQFGEEPSKEQRERANSRGTSASFFLAPNWRAQGWPTAEGAIPADPVSPGRRCEVKPKDRDENRQSSLLGGSAWSAGQRRLNCTSMVARTSTGLPFRVPGRNFHLVAISCMAFSSRP